MGLLRLACQSAFASIGVSDIQDEQAVENISTMLLGKVEALTVDSASDELLAGELMRGNSTDKKANSMTPNLKLVIRDVTHAARRTDSSHLRPFL